MDAGQHCFSVLTISARFARRSQCWPNRCWRIIWQALPVSTPSTPQVLPSPWAIPRSEHLRRVVHFGCRTLRRAFAETKPPETVAAAVYEFITEPPLENPRRVGRVLAPPLAPAYSVRRGLLSGAVSDLRALPPGHRHGDLAPRRCLPH